MLGFIDKNVAHKLGIIPANVVHAVDADIHNTIHSSWENDETVEQCMVTLRCKDYKVTEDYIQAVYNLLTKGESI